MLRDLSKNEFDAVYSLVKYGPESCARIFTALQAVLPK